MNENLTEIVCILDRSGSMSATRDDAIGGFNTFLEEQKELEGEAQMTVILFDDHYEPLYDGVPISEVEPLDDTTFVPRGMTALYDAVGRTIDTVGARLAKMAEEDRPANVIFVILTDGHENSSHEYTGLRIKNMITHQTDKYSWEFLFLAANIDAKIAAGDMGINTSNSMTYTADSSGNAKAYDSISRAVGSYRIAGSIDPKWADDDSDSDTYTEST